jgi:hypothetical protein
LEELPHAAGAPKEDIYPIWYYFGNITQIKFNINIILRSDV